MPPVNDNFADAITISGTTTQLVSLVDATTEESGVPDVWYKITPGADQAIRIDLEKVSGGGGIFPAVWVYEQTGTTELDLVDHFLNDVNPIGEVADDFQSPFAFLLNSGTTYYLEGYQSDFNNGITFDMTVTFVTRPANDDWEDAIVIDQAGGTQVVASTINATVQNNSEEIVNNYPSVWYRVEAIDDEK